MSTLHSKNPGPPGSSVPMTELSSTSALHSALLSSSGQSTASGTIDDEPGPGAMLPHWENTYPNLRPCLQPVFYYAFKILCLMAMGRSTLRRVWHVVNLADEFEFQKEKERLSVMIRTTNIVGGLILTSTASLVTTSPPRADIINYNTRGPYGCLFISFGITIGGIVVGCAVLFVLSSVSAKWARDTFMETRLRIWIMLMLLAYPFLSIAVGTIVNVMGLLAATWISEDHLANIAGVGLFLVPVSCVGLFAFISRKRTQSASNVKPDAEANVVSVCAASPDASLIHDREHGFETSTLLRGRQTRASTL